MCSIGSIHNLANYSSADDCLLNDTIHTTGGFVKIDTLRAILPVDRWLSLTRECHVIYIKWKEDTRAHAPIRHIRSMGSPVDHCETCSKYFTLNWTAVRHTYGPCSSRVFRPTPTHPLAALRSVTCACVRCDVPMYVYYMFIQVPVTHAVPLHVTAGKSESRETEMRQLRSARSRPTRPKTDHPLNLTPISKRFSLSCVFVCACVYSRASIYAYSKQHIHKFPLHTACINNVRTFLL